MLRVQFSTTLKIIKQIFFSPFYQLDLLQIILCQTSVIDTIYRTFVFQNGLPEQNRLRINSVEVPPQLSHNRHPEHGWCAWWVLVHFGRSFCDADLLAILPHRSRASIVRLQPWHSFEDPRASTL